MAVDFSKIFSQNAPSTPFVWTDAEYLQGWDVIQNTPPTRQQFNALQMISDEKDLELYNTKAPIHSPVFTGDPQAPTPVAGDNDKSIATTAFVKTAIENAMAGTTGGRGWIKFDNKTVIQWGGEAFSSGTGIYTINFPITFPTACAAFTAIDAGVSTSGGDHSFICAVNGSATASSIQVGAYSGTAWLISTVGISWIAVGY